MILSILSAVLLAAGIGLLFIDCNDYDDTPLMCGSILSVFGGISLTVCLAFIFSLHINVPAIEAKYETLKISVENYRPQDYGNQSALLENVLGMNYTIADHKVKSQNPWVDVFYSEEIGNLKPLYLSK